MRPSVSISLIFGQFLLCSLCFAQANKIDSLSKLVPLLHDTAKIDCLNDLSYSYIQILKKDSAEYYAKSALNEAKEQNYIHSKD